ncbi:MAG: TonB family protein [Syntrophus sp. (in: bacteria)]
MESLFKSKRLPLQKAFVSAILISLASHVLVLSMPIIGESPSPRPQKASLLTVHLTEPIHDHQGKNDDKKPVTVRKQPAPTPAATAETVDREDTVSLGSEDSRYRYYLLKIRKRIENQWTYPKAALQKKEKGTTTARFSIDKNGALSSQEVVSSSGSQLLDEYTLAVIRAVAPYDRLPVDMGLSRLHIVAVFHYRLAE